MSHTQVHRWASLYKYLPFAPSEKKKFLMLCFVKGLLSFFFTMIKIQKSNNLVTGHGTEKVPAAKMLVFVLSLLVVVFFMAMRAVIVRINCFMAFYGAFSLYLRCIVC